jgi:hypothetical protein
MRGDGVEGPKLAEYYWDHAGGVDVFLVVAACAGSSALVAAFIRR